MKDRRPDETVTRSGDHVQGQRQPLGSSDRHPVILGTDEVDRPEPLRQGVSPDGAQQGARLRQDAR